MPNNLNTRAVLIHELITHHVPFDLFKHSGGVATELPQLRQGVDGSVNFYVLLGSLGDVEILDCRHAHSPNKATYEWKLNAGPLRELVVRQEAHRNNDGEWYHVKIIVPTPEGEAYEFVFSPQLSDGKGLRPIMHLPSSAPSTLPHVGTILMPMPPQFVRVFEEFSNPLSRRGFIKALEQLPGATRSIVGREGLSLVRPHVTDIVLSRGPAEVEHHRAFFDHVRDQLRELLDGWVCVNHQDVEVDGGVRSMWHFAQGKKRNVFVDQDLLVRDGKSHTRVRVGVPVHKHDALQYDFGWLELDWVSPIFRRDIERAHIIDPKLS